MPIDQKTFFTALGFVAVVMSDVPQDRQAERAVAIAKLMEAFCIMVATEGVASPVVRS